jgi:transposase
VAGTVALRRHRPVCPECEFSTSVRYDTRPVVFSWRHLDLGALRLEVKAELRRVDCPAHGNSPKGVPFAPAHSGFTRDFEDLVAWLASSMEKTAICRLVRIDWKTS